MQPNLTATKPFLQISLYYTSVCTCICLFINFIYISIYSSHIHVWVEENVTELWESNKCASYLSLGLHMVDMLTRFLTLSLCIGSARGRAQGNQRQSSLSSSFCHLVPCSLCGNLFFCASIDHTTDSAPSVVPDIAEQNKKEFWAPNK